MISPKLELKPSPREHMLSASDTDTVSPASVTDETDSVKMLSRAILTNAIYSKGEHIRYSDTICHYTSSMELVIC